MIWMSYHVFCDFEIIPMVQIVKCVVMQSECKVKIQKWKVLEDKICGNAKWVQSENP